MKRGFTSPMALQEMCALWIDTSGTVTSIPVGPRAWWMAQTPDKKLIYVTVGRPNQMPAIDVETNKVVARTAAGTLPWGVTIATLD